jgi:hypothetical protein
MRDGRGSAGGQRRLRRFENLSLWSATVKLGALLQALDRIERSSTTHGFRSFSYALTMIRKGDASQKCSG